MQLRNKYFTRINKLYLTSILLFHSSKYIIFKVFESHVDFTYLKMLALFIGLLVSYLPFFIDNNFAIDEFGRIDHKPLEKKQIFYFSILSLMLNVVSYLIINNLENSLNSVGFTILRGNIIADGPLDIILMCAHSVILAPIIEELIYRDYILRKLSNFGYIFAMIVSSLLFAFSHGNLSQFISNFALGLFLAYIYLITGSIRTSIFLHALYNFYTIVYNEVFFKIIEPSNRGIFLIAEFLIIFLLSLYSVYSLCRGAKAFAMKEKFDKGQLVNYKVYFLRITSLLIFITSLIFIIMSVKKLGG